MLPWLAYAKISYRSTKSDSQWRRSICRHITVLCKVHRRQHILPLSECTIWYNLKSLHSFPSPVEMKRRRSCDRTTSGHGWSGTLHVRSKYDYRSRRVFDLNRHLMKNEAIPTYLPIEELQRRCGVCHVIYITPTSRTAYLTGIREAPNLAIIAPRV